MSYPVKPKLTIASNLPAVEDGSVVATTDTGELYIDANGVRTKLTDVIVGTYSDIINLVAPLSNKIYFATDTNQLLQASYGGRGRSLTWKILNGYTLPTASQSVLGGVKVDGTTIHINSSGVISATGGSGNAGTKDAGNSIVPKTEFTLDPGYVEGNARGYGSVDLQRYRNDASHVVSGGQSFGAGSNNTCIGSGSTVFGWSNTVKGNTSAVFGMNNIAEGDSSYIFGDKITQTREGDPICGIYAGKGYSADLGRAIIHNVVLNSNGDIEEQSEEPVFGHTGFKGICIRKPRANQSYEIIKVGTYTALLMEIQSIQYDSNKSCYMGTLKLSRKPLMDYITVSSNHTWEDPFYNGYVAFEDNKIICRWERNWEFVQLGVWYTIFGKGVEEPHQSGYYGYGYDGYGYGYGYGYGS